MARHQNTELSQSKLSLSLGYKNGQFISNIERALCSIPPEKITETCDQLLIVEEELIIAIVKDFEMNLRNEIAYCMGKKMDDMSANHHKFIDAVGLATAVVV